MVFVTDLGTHCAHTYPIHHLARMTVIPVGGGVLDKQGSECKLVIVVGYMGKERADLTYYKFSNIGWGLCLFNCIEAYTFYWKQAIIRDRRTFLFEQNRLTEAKGKTRCCAYF